MDPAVKAILTIYNSARDTYGEYLDNTVEPYATLAAVTAEAEGIK